MVHEVAIVTSLDWEMHRRTEIFNRYEQISQYLLHIFEKCNDFSIHTLSFYCSPIAGSAHGLNYNTSCYNIHRLCGFQEGLDAHVTNIILSTVHY